MCRDTRGQDVIMAWHVYLLECSDKTLYCGVTKDLDRRLAEHNGLSPGGARYTFSRRPVRLLAAACCRDRSSACALEARIKRLPRSRKLVAMREACQSFER
jgi:putative endonuclease